MKEIQLYDHPIFNALTRTNSYHAIILYIIISTFVAGYAAIYLPMNPIYQILAFFGGLLLFTLVEYLLHRFVYHLGDYMNKGNWQYKIHGVHHDDPRDKSRLAMPIPLALLLAFLIFLLFKSLLGTAGYYLFSTFLLGYALYLFVHYTVHSRMPPKNALRYLWIHHHLHHHKYEDKAFGVSSPLWDYVFGTMPPEKK
jgi:sterol desaturase/sphingolipid hydroxylase (fatty acid hydroxylase superfamily)